MAARFFKLQFMIFIMLIFCASVIHAQNFANIENEVEEEDYSDDILTDEQIQMILESEGIPLSRPAKGLDMDIVNASNSQYTLGVNDVIEISVLRHPEVSGQFMINSEGKIQYEFVGDIELSGLTKDEIKEVITEYLSKYIIAPDVTVKIVGYNSKVIYVIGEVASPGKIIMRGDTMTVREALVQAGLPLLTAKTGASRLITPSDDGSPKLVKVNVHKLLYVGDLRQNLIMNPGDTLYVPATIMTKALRAIQPVSAPVGQASGLGRTATTGF